MKAKITSLVQSIRKPRLPDARKHLKFILIFTSVLLVGLLGVCLWARQESSKSDRKDSQPIDIKQITDLSNKGDCSKSLHELEGVKPSTKDTEGSVSLLSYRANCYYLTKQYQKSLIESQELKKYYEIYHNDKLVAQTDKFIEQLKKYVANPPAANTQPHTDADQQNTTFQERLTKLQELN